MAVNRYRPRRTRNWGDALGGTADAVLMGLRYLGPAVKMALILVRSLAWHTVGGR
jgi:hypothetical protein